VIEGTPALRTGLTPYARAGDVPVLAAGGLALLVAWGLEVRSRRRRSGEQPPD
jgi:apolipoprotein N-acyltransferase